MLQKQTNLKLALFGLAVAATSFATRPGEAQEAQGGTYDVWYGFEGTTPLRGAINEAERDKAELIDGFQQAHGRIDRPARNAHGGKYYVGAHWRSGQVTARLDNATTGWRTLNMRYRPVLFIEDGVHGDYPNFYARFKRFYQVEVTAEGGGEFLALRAWYSTLRTEKIELETCGLWQKHDVSVNFMKNRRVRSN